MIIDLDSSTGRKAMVSTVSSQQAIYRSVPPCPVAYTLTNELDRLRDKHRSSTAPVYTNTPENFAHRFRSRPITRPKVIQFDGSSIRQRGHPLTRRYMPVLRARLVTETTKLQPAVEDDHEVLFFFLIIEQLTALVIRISLCF